ncbi:MAG: hypothetical protein KatS3mg045_0350 [Bellilinea sp.]|nr:MAG: hypothetical protein KatS3mg045_0350 [Bellilinea sp.]
MRLRRLIWFVVMIGIGAAAGIFYGWVLRPTQTSGFALHTLRSDYKADYVLMTAEIYRKDGDLAAALERLNALEDTLPLRQVQQAILTGQQLGYARSDIETLANLFQALQKGLPSLTPTTAP